MDTQIVEYALKANLYLVLFYACYWLFFRKHTFFQWNRWYLLGSLVAGLLLPIINFDPPVDYIPPMLSYAASAPQVIVITPDEFNINLPLWNCVAGIYAIGILWMLGRLLHSLFLIGNIIIKGQKVEFEANNIVIIPKGARQSGSFSFFRWLVISEDDYLNNPDKILRHELVHISEWHSLDILLVEILKVVFWVNPVVWLYKRSIEAVHEYVADQQAENRDSYARFLVSYAWNAPEDVLSNRFFTKSILKARIQMLYKNRTSRWMLGKYLMIVPVTLLALSLTAARERIAEELDFPEPVFEKSDSLHVTGIVTDRSGRSVKGATVILKNATRGTTTDINGKFEFPDVPENGILIITHIKYLPAELTLNADKKYYNVVLTEDKKPLKAAVTAGSNASPSQRPAASPAATSQREGFTISEQKPQFPGGASALAEYLKSNIKYPKSAIDAKKEGVTVLQFTVDETGGISNIVIVKGIGYGLDAESVRVVKAMPKWEPAIQNGQPLAMNETIEIHFQIPGSVPNKASGFNLPYQGKFPLQYMEIDRKEVSVDPTRFENGMARNEALKPVVKPSNSHSYYTKSTDTSSYRFMNYNSRAFIPRWTWGKGQ